ncbi:MAG: dTMP kinase [Myxococcota bacterium]|nr:dTMP kinase [Myxococcota bacterium]
MRPRFIAIEGLDGSGGSTQARLLADWLESSGPSVCRTQEPSSGPAGQFIRAALDPTNPASVLGDNVLPYLFAADRRDHLDREILPALVRGQHVVTDRYYHSSLAYQSLSVGLHLVAELNRDFRAPDLTIFLDLSPEACLERIHARGAPIERFEALDRLRQIQDAYEAVLVHCRSHGEAIVRISASGPIDAVHERVLAAVRSHLDD